MDPGLVHGLKVLFLPLLTSACVGQPEGSRCVNVPCSALLAMMGHQQNVLKLTRIQALSKNNNLGGLDPPRTECFQPERQCGFRR